MNAPQLPAPPTAALRRLADFLQESGSTLAPAQAATQAIDEWIRNAQAQCGTPMPVRGYQWKSLFLPEGTQLRVDFAGQDFYAYVVGDHIVFEGRPVSPRQMMLAIAGEGRNAWRDLRLRLPGDTRWRPARVLRDAAGAQPPPQPVSPLEAMQAAAACMAETLRSALALVEHANAHALARHERHEQHERRVQRHRRAQDLMEDDCRAD